MNAQDLRSTFKRLFNAEPILVRSPGRINIIGEHTDYNGGFVMPAAIDKAIYVAISKREDDEIHLFSESYQQFDISSIKNLQKSENSWANYILGVADQLKERGYALGGFNFYIDGDVPLGAGLSSSAAVECATGFALDQLFSLEVPKLDIALVAQKAEQTFAGVNCGIMDQFASVFGQKDQAIMLDCRTMQHSYIPLKLDGYKLLLLNTNVKHALADSAYNKRRAQCEQGVAWIKEHYPNVNTLRDVTLEMLEAHVKPKDEEVFTKCSFVVKEIGRLLTAAEQLVNGNLHGLGHLMFETHEGLSKDYEVSCKELDFLVAEVKPLDEVLGARMMGGGFGGCTINIVKEEKIADLIEELSSKYLLQFGLKLDAYIVQTDNGTSLFN
ncbi:galactokinase [Pedobacter suwonensis]|uniref:galactokinase n=1 Tax=Pedobacter suwonensis TaxID=332999 RepID=UPI0025FAAC04|nr:galactokinase [uncultured Pedobacter sp.]